MKTNPVIIHALFSSVLISIFLLLVPKKRTIVPLMMAYVTRYIYGTDKLRTNAFEVRGLNGVSSGIIHCDDLAILSQWLKLITDNIVGLTQLQVRE